ncbi:MAG TPA: hypothetical protein VGO56_02060 [Pyrinomonadaceae bacterium]|jgi:hypothetical protein|nr:hypothetical protein [Pyrinomonadaceae bacterium]
MTPLTFPEIAKLLNLSGTTEINLEPIRQSDDGHWSLYHGQHKIHDSSYPFSVLYFQASATHEAIRNAARFADENTYVVHPPSLRVRGLDMRSLFRHAKGLWTTKAYLVSFIRRELDTYLKKLAEERPRFYIDPRILVPAGMSRRIPNPVLSFLRDRDGEIKLGGGRLGVVLAEPGQGKTYMSRYLSSSILERDKDLVPLVVNSLQWETLAVEEQRQLMKTLAHSFEYYGASIGWLHGNEREFFDVTLKADIFRIVFDGFDEYILRNRGKVVAKEVLDALNELANSTGSRIVITSRTSFWHNSVSADPSTVTEDPETFPESAEVASVVDESPKPMTMFQIQPFDLEYAKNYFKNRLTSERQRELASNVYRELQTVSADLAGRGFVLSLIARLFEDQHELQTVQVESRNPLLWLMFALCEREQERQSLPFNSREQIEVLSAFATEVAVGERPDSELLELAIRVVKPNLDSETVAETLEKFQSHPLIEKEKESDRWQFRHDQIWITLLATEILTLSLDRLASFVDKIRIDVDFSQDLALRILDLVKNRYHGADQTTKLKDLIKAMLAEPTSESAVPQHRAARLAATLALQSLDELKPKASHVERTKFLQRLCDRESLSALTFSGTVARLDLHGMRFVDCRFERVVWANCQFDKHTVFQKCTFEGLASPQHSEGFGYTQFVDCRLDPEAERVVEMARVKAGIKRYSTEELRADIDNILRKFIAKGGVGLKSVDSRYILLGEIADSPNKEVVLEVLCESALEGRQLQGHTKVEYRVRKEAEDEMKFYATNNVLTGALKRLSDKLSRRLMLT